MSDKKDESKKKGPDSEQKLTSISGCPVVDNQNVLTAGPRGHSFCRMFGSWRNWPISTVR